MKEITLPKFIQGIMFLALLLLISNLAVLAQVETPSNEFLLYEFESTLSADGLTLYNGIIPLIVVDDPNPALQGIKIPAPEIDKARSDPDATSAIFSFTYVAAGDSDLWGQVCATFPEAAKTAFEAAASIWASTLQSSVPITIRACWANLGSPSILGYSGGGPYHRNFSGAPLSNTWYQGSLANSLHGSDLDASSFDMHITYNLGFSWYYGTDGNTPTGQHDLVTVAAHEIAHGLGISGLADFSGGVGSFGANGSPDIYDTFLEDGGGTKLTSYANPSTALGSLLTSGDLWFDGSNANAANWGSRVRMYAPSTWASGSSYSHLDYTTFAGTVNSMMVYAISSGSSNHNPGPVATGLLKDLGWVSTATTPPGAFAKTSPSNSSTGQSINPTLSWGASSGVSSYEYCYDTSNDNTCSSWVSTGTTPSANPSGLNPNTTYYWQVRANNADGTTYADGSNTSYWSFTTAAATTNKIHLPLILRTFSYTPPGAFNKTSPTNGTTGQPTNPTLSWETSSNATSYEYCIDTTNNSACDTSWISTTTNTSVGLNGLSPSTTYYWQVRAKNSSSTTYANGATTNYWSFTTSAQLPPPGAFNKTTPANGATEQPANPTLSWQTSSNATSYEYCIDTTNNSACDTSWMSTTTNTSVGLSGLSPSTTYYWQVRANNDADTTYANSGTWWSLVTAAASSVIPVDGQWVGRTDQDISLGFQVQNNGTQWYFFIVSCPGGGMAIGGPGAIVSGQMSASDSLVAFNGQFSSTTYATGSYDTASCGPGTWWAAPVPAGAFNKTAPTNGATGQPANATLSWETSSNATSYEYCYDTSNDNACSTWISTGTNTSVGLSGLSPSTTYYWQVRASNASGTTYANGSSTSYWSFTTAAALPAPGAFNKSTPANGATEQFTSLSLSWGASSNATSYEYCYDTSNDNACSTWTSTGTNTSVGLSGLSLSTTYYWQVRASNASGTTYANGSSTSYWSFTTTATPPPAGIVNGDFENGSTGWTEYSTHGWSIILSIPEFPITPRSGDYGAWLGGDYDDISYIEQQVTIPIGTPYLSYWHWIDSVDICGYDFGGVLINSIIVEMYDLCTTENTGGWVQRSVDLSAYAGQSVTLQIRAETDSSGNSNLFVDDVSLQASASASGQIFGANQNPDISIIQTKRGIVKEERKPPDIKVIRILHPW